MKKSTKRIARVGLFSKGLIYFISGLLTCLAALSLGGGTSGKFKVLDFLEKQPLGNVLLVILALGLICFSIWRAVQCFWDPEDIGDDKKGMVKRVGFGISGLAYLVIAFISLKKAFGGNSGGGSKNYIDMFGATAISIVFIIIGLALAGKAIFHLKKAIKGDFIEKFSIPDLKYHKMAKYLGYFGFYARAVVIGIIAFFFIKAGIYTNQNEIKGTKEAFKFLQDSEYGTILMAVVSAGLASYGIFMLLLARYRKFEG